MQGRLGVTGQWRAGLVCSMACADLEPVPRLLAGRWRARCEGQVTCMVGCMAIEGASHVRLTWCEGGWPGAGPVLAWC